MACHEKACKMPSFPSRWIRPGSREIHDLFEIEPISQREESGRKKMQKNTIVAIVLTFVVIVLWGFIQSKYFPETVPKPPAPEVKKEQTATPERGVEKESGVVKEASVEKEKAKSPVKDIPKKEVSVETENYWAVFTSDGARLKHFKFKKYYDRVEGSGIAITLTGWIDDLFGKKKRIHRKPEPLDLVNTDEGEGLPLGVIIDSNPSLTAGNWESDKDNVVLKSKGEKGQLSFERTLENGLKVVKRYGFESDGDTIDLNVEVENTTSKEISSQLGLGWIGKIEIKKFAEEDNKDFGLKYSFLKGQKVEVKDLSGAGSSGCTPGCQSKKTAVDPFEFIDKGDIEWFSFGGEYFTALLIPPPGKGSVTLTVKGGEKDLLKADITPAPFVIAPHQTVKIPYRVYMGPKEKDRLKGLGIGAEKLVDFGFFGVVANPILWLLNVTNSVTKNFGIDIIILSILIKLIFLPLTQMSFKSMKEMQKVQPEMKRLQETYKNDKARLQQEMMLLYKRRKINPMSGCLPMVIQIPVFIALYNVLQYTFEMRHAPFFWWIQDLSAKDPIYITPLIMGATMVIQQKMTPTAADPAQAKLFMLMPIMFTFLFLSFPSGLVLYWLVNNVLSIAHQYYINNRK
jgi:YidC/Oxa1 family membrane protein insertase